MGFKARIVWPLLLLLLLACKNNAKRDSDAVVLFNDPASGIAQNFTSAQEMDDIRDFVQITSHFVTNSAAVFHGFSDSSTQPVESLATVIESGNLGVPPQMFRFFGDALMENSKQGGFVFCSLVNEPPLCKSNGSVGYGLCTLRNHPAICEAAGTASASIGFGICSMFNQPKLCAATGSMGYGLCTMIRSNPEDPSSPPRYSAQQCLTRGSVGYALCMASPRGNPALCAPYKDSSLGFGICAQKNSLNLCKRSGSPGYGYCSLVQSSLSMCPENASLALGFCTLKTKSMGYCQNYIR